MNRRRSHLGSPYKNRGFLRLRALWRTFQEKTHFSRWGARSPLFEGLRWTLHKNKVVRRFPRFVWHKCGTCLHFWFAYPPKHAFGCWCHSVFSVFLVFSVVFSCSLPLYLHSLPPFPSSPCRSTGPGSAPATSSSEAAAVVACSPTAELRAVPSAPSPRGCKT